MRTARVLLPSAFLALLLAAPTRAQELAQIQTIQDSADGLSGAWSVAVTPDGENAYVASRFDDSLAMFVRDLGTDQWKYIGKLTDGVDGVDGLDGADDVAVSPDGLLVYVTAIDDDSIAIFERLGSPGYLQYVDIVKNGDLGVPPMADPTAVAVVPSGTDAGRVFVTSAGDDSLLAFDPTNFESLVPFGSWTDGVDGVEGIAGASDVIALAGDWGADVYVTGRDDSALALFGTDPPPAFAWRQVLVDGQDGVDGLAGAQALAASPNGHHIFVAANTEAAVSGFYRADDGRLSFESIARDGVAGAIGLQSPRAVEMDPSGDQLYVAGGFLFFSTFIPEVTTFTLDSFDFSIDYASVVALNGYPSLYLPQPNTDLAILPNGTRVLVTQSALSTLSIFDRDGSTGALALHQTIADGEGVVGVEGAQDVVVSPDGKNVYVLGRDEALVSEFSRDAATGVLHFAGFQRTSGYSTRLTPRYRNQTMSPDGKNLYVFDYRDQRITVFRRDVTPGRLYPVQAVDGDSGAFPVSLQFDEGAVSPDGAQVYVLSPLQDAISVFARDAGTGLLTHLATHREGDVDLNVGMYAPQSVVAAPNGNVYVGGSANVSMPIRLIIGAAGEIISATLFGLAPGQPYCDGISMAIDPSFTHLVTGQYSETICSLLRDPTNGLLTYAGAAFAAVADGYVRSVEVSPDATRVYAAYYDGTGIPAGHSALVSFAMTPTGLLSRIDELSDQTPGVDHTQGLSSVAVSPDGRTVYGAAYLDDAVVAFAPEPDRAAIAISALAALVLLAKSRSS